MQKTFLLIIMIFLAYSSLHAKKVLGNLNFEQGTWALVGVPLHNYQSMPIQRELGTFITKDISFIKSIQQNWELERTFDDKCDYHYALKFYQNGILVETIKLNLSCGYLTSGGFSYNFNPSEFEAFKRHSTSIEWSRISFADTELLKKAIQKLDTRKDVYWYDDVQQYMYPGYFTFSVNELPWNTNLDSLQTSLENSIRQQANGTPFYLKKYYHVFRYDNLLVRYIVNCEPSLASKVQLKKTLAWRSHLADRDSIRIVAIGVNRKKYWDMMDE